MTDICSGLQGARPRSPHSAAAVHSLRAAVAVGIVPEQKLLLLTVLAERPELLGLNSLLSSSEKGDSEAGDTLCCCWGRWGRRIKRGIRLRAVSFSPCCALSSFSKWDIREKTKGHLLPPLNCSLPLLGSASAEPHFWILNLHRAVLVSAAQMSSKTLLLI